MRRFCAWCGKYMGEKPPLDDKTATHGMCKKCFKIQMGLRDLKQLEDKLGMQYKEGVKWRK